jgi:hypothetical protein
MHKSMRRLSLWNMIFWLFPIGCFGLEATDQRVLVFNDEPVGLRLAKVPQPVFVYPGERNREALVYVRIKVNSKGIVDEANAVTGGFHEPRFLEAAEILAKRYKFMPFDARDGLSFREVVVPLSYRLTSDSPHKVTRTFKDSLKSFEGKLASKDFSAAEAALDQMLIKDVTLVYEYRLLEFARAGFFAATGRTHEALEILRTFSVRSFRPEDPKKRYADNQLVLSRSTMIELFRLRSSLAGSLGFHAESLLSLLEIIALSPPGKTAAEEVEANQLRQLLKSSEALVTVGRFDRFGNFSHDFTRNAFKLDGFDTVAISRLSVYCDPKSATLDMASNVIWRADQSLLGCRLFGDGAPGTQLRITETGPAMQ